MRFTEHELTAALTGAAKSVLAAQDKDIRKGRRTADEAWEALGKFQRFQILDGLGDQLLPVLVALPDVEVEPGTRPAVSEGPCTAAVGARLRVMGGQVRRAVLLKARVALVQVALAHVPPRQDPDALIVPDHL